jgi:hypothetical protein
MAQEHQIPMVARERLRRYRMNRVDKRAQLRKAQSEASTLRVEIKKLRAELRTTPTVAQFSAQLGIDSKVGYGIAQRVKRYCKLPEDEVRPA